MKKLKLTSLITLLFSFFFISVNAQENPSSQSYMVHEDRVNPSKVEHYEKHLKDLVMNCKKYNLPNSSWIVTATNNYRYLYVSPIEKMGDLDVNRFAALGEKMGNEALQNIFKEIDKCYDQHGSYILVLDKNLTYMPGGITQTPEGQQYRKFHYYYVTPENYSKFYELGKAVKDLYAKKGAKINYRVYRSGFGNMDTYFMVAVAAKSAEDFEKMSAENKNLLGDEGKKLHQEILKLTSRYEAVTGSMRPDLAYASK
jgi:hypothetical protein